MVKKVIVAWIAVFAAWFLMDWVIHGNLLMQTYRDTASLWRPEGEMKPIMMWIASAVSALCMVLVFALFFRERSVKTGFIFGLLLGIMWGMNAGFATYGYMPIPYMLAQAWFWAMLMESVAAGVIIGAVVRE
jgi:hypothetical protein